MKNTPKNTLTLIALIFCFALLPPLSLRGDESSSEKNAGEKKATKKNPACQWCREEVTPQLLYCPNCSRFLPQIKEEIRHYDGVKISYKYNKENRLVEKSIGEEDSLVFTYSYEKNRLEKLQRESLHFRSVTSFVYTANGHLLKAQTQGNATAVEYYFYRDDNLLRHSLHTDHSAQLTEYTYFPGSRQCKRRSLHILYLNLDGKLKLEKNSVWTYQRDKGRISGATLKETIQMEGQKAQTIQGRAEFKYNSGGKLERIIYYREKKKTREIAFRVTE